MIINTLAAMAAGYVLSMVFGTPKKFRAQDIVSRIAAALAPKISAKYQDNEGGRRTAGIVFLLSLIAVTVLPVLVVLILLYCFIPALALVLDALICWSVLDIKGVTTASTGVARAMRGKNYAKAQRIASDLSRTDCSELDEKGLVRAAVQGVADRTVDSAAAPMLCMFLLSAAGSVFFTAADCAAEISDEGEDFTAPAEKLRRALCFIPGKFAYLMMLVDALFLKLNTRAAERVMKSDIKCTRSCFAGCRAVMAGIMGISLLPEEVYSEQFLRTYTIGEQLKDPEPADITLANSLLQGTAFIMMMMVFIVKLTIGVWF